MWDKFEYLLNNPTKVERNLWWLYHANRGKTVESPSERNIKLCTPFVIKILNRDNSSCVKCPWFRFCTGCILDPIKNDYIEIKPTHVIMIEWCSEIVKKEINENNLNLILNINEMDVGASTTKLSDAKSENGKKRGSYSDKITLEDCINLFTEKEDLNEDLLYCSKCKIQTNFFKQYDFERLPTYLIIALKRFKFTKMYKRKIDCLIDYPIYDLDLYNYLVDYSMSKSKGYHTYDLYGVVNHMGSLGGGHYVSMMKQGSKWIKYDDSHTTEIDESLVKSNNGYILIYKLKDERPNLYYNLLSEIYFNDELTRAKTTSDTILSKASKGIGVPLGKYFYVGEPVTTPYGNGLVIETYYVESTQFVKVKFKFGYGYIK
jgi:hypothetical protein